MPAQLSSARTFDALRSVICMNPPPARPARSQGSSARPASLGTGSSPAKVTRVPDLPLEIWSCVVREAAHDDRTPRQSGLRSLRLVNSLFDREVLRHGKNFCSSVASGETQRFLEGDARPVDGRLADLLAFAPHLDLHQLELNQAGKLHQLQSIWQAALNLRSIDIDCTSLPDQTSPTFFAELAQPSRLTHLCIRGEGIPPGFSQSLRSFNLSAMQQLRTLTICDLEIDDSLFESLQVPSRSLRSLTLTNNLLGAGDASRSMFTRFSKLCELNIKSNNFTASAWRFYGIDKMPALKEISASENLFDFDIENFPMRLPSTLQVLVADFCGIHGALSQHLILRGHQQLRRLSLVGNHLGNTGAASLDLTDLPLLRILSLCFNQIGSEGAAALTFSGCPKLQGLDISNNPIRDAGARGLRLQQLTELTHLEAGACRLGKRSAPLFSFAPQARLKVLDLAENCFTTHSLASLQLTQAPLSELRSLDLSYNLRLELTSLARLMVEIPRCIQNIFVTGLPFLDCLRSQPPGNTAPLIGTEELPFQLQPRGDDAALAPVRTMAASS